MPTVESKLPFVRHCGIGPIEFDGERTRTRLALEPHHLNNFGIAHGGLVCTLLDTAMGTASRMTTGKSVMTVDMNVTFVSPGRGALLVEGSVLRAGRSIVFAEAEIRTEAGELVARSTGTMKVVPTPAEGPAADG